MTLLRRLIHEAHRRSLWQVLGIYLFGSWGVLEAVQGVTDSVGLPDWTPGFASVLLLIGLPIVMATACVQEGAPALGREPAGAPGSAGGDRASAPAVVTGEVSGAGSPAQAVHPPANLAPGTGSLDRPSTRPPLLRRLLTWRRALLGGVLAFALLAASVGLYFAMWSAGIGPVGSLVAQGVMEEGATLVLADFRDTSGSEVGGVVTEALRVDLQSSTALNVVPPAQLQSALGRMGLPSDATVTEEVAREIAVRDGYATYLHGEAARVGRGYVLTSSIVSAAGGDVLAGFRATAASEAELIGAIDKLSQDVRERAGESLRSIKAGEPLEVVTTPSLRALELFGRAQALSTRGDDAGAVPLLEEALALDPDFAMAHRKLSVSLNNQSKDPARAREAASRAYELRDRLTERERGLAEAYYFTAVVDDPDRSARAYRSVLERYPDDPTALNNLGVYGLVWGEYEEAERALRRAVEGPFPTENAFQNRVGALWALGREGEALATLERWKERFPDAGGPTEHFLLAALGRWDEAHAVAESEVRSETGRLAAQVFGRRDLAAYDLARGRWREAMEHLDEAERAALDAGQPFMYLTGPVSLRALALFGTLGSVDEARAHLVEALERAGEGWVTSDWRVALMAGRLALVGESARARATWERFASLSEDPGARGFRWGEALYEALSALGSGEYGEAAGRFETLYSRLWPCGETCFGRVEQGLALEGAGRADEAVAALEAQLDRWPVGGALHSEVVPLMPLALDRLGHLYEARGDRAAAAGAYERLLAMWPDPDPELEPIVANARARIRELTAAAGGG